MTSYVGNEFNTLHSFATVKQGCIHQLARQALKYPIWQRFDTLDRLATYRHTKSSDSHLSHTQPVKQPASMRRIKS